MEILRHPHDEHPHSPTARPNEFGHVPDLHQVFDLTLAAIAERQDLAAARHTSWYDVVVLSGVSHGVEVALRQKSKDASTFVFRGSQVDNQLAILTSLTRESGEESFEVRVLRIPNVVPFSFWLKARSDRKDRIVPVVSSTSQLQVGRLYKPKEFFAAIRKTAAHLVAIRLLPTAPPGRTKTEKTSGKVRARKSRSGSRSRRNA
jgi:hypothetical protein